MLIQGIIPLNIETNRSNSKHNFSTYVLLAEYWSSGSRFTKQLTHRACVSAISFIPMTLRMVGNWSFEII